LAELIEAGDLASGSGRRRVHSGLVDRYVEEISSAGEDLSGFELIIDAGNGMAGEIAPRVFEGRGAKVHRLYCEPDGNFPNHEADPTQPANLQDLIRSLAETPGARVGLGYDGDADRIGVVEPDGQIVYGDRLLIMLARDLLKKGPATILCDVKCTSLLEQDVERHGGRLVMWKTGHSLIKAKMKEVKAALAGEMSGHMFYADGYYGYDDAIYASLRAVNILARSGRSVSELLADLPETVSTPEIRVACPEQRKAEVVGGLTESLRGRYRILDLDGVRFSTESGWGLVRASNTQPVLVLRFEATTEQELDELQTVARDGLGKLGLEPGF
jgi:phosphomannomutase/phosphoglucomutase